MSGRDAYANAIRRRQQLLEEIAEIDRFLRLYEKYSNEISDDIDETIDQNTGMPQKDFPTFMRNILRNAGSPLNSRQILSLMKLLNVPIGGSDELRNLTTKLWRARDEIVRLDNRTYWPRDLPIPQEPDTT